MAASMMSGLAGDKKKPFETYICSLLNIHTELRSSSRPVGGTDDKNILLVRHAIHLSQDLVDDSVGCAACVACSTSPGFGDGVQLIKEQDAGRRLSGLRGGGATSPGGSEQDTGGTSCCESCSHLIKHLSDVGLGLSEPHGEHLRAFNGHKVCLALVGDGLGQQGLSTARGAIEEHATGRSHSELQELVWVLDWIL